ncbi:hypothetical protein CK203_003771 [Vitis vinifera]|uniref:DNA topoisomerase 1 n=1 Tax=Vitis vinifera TaxID=29760 RepID=A0A438K845_VITVI|nr:hypothetical protein CK203_003771 [Vitis vinifera]
MCKARGGEEVTGRSPERLFRGSEETKKPQKKCTFRARMTQAKMEVARRRQVRLEVEARGRKVTHAPSRAVEDLLLAHLMVWSVSEKDVAGKVAGGEGFLTLSGFIHRYIAKMLDGDDDEEVASQDKTFEEPKVLGLSPGSSEKILLKNGPYGFYLQLGEDRKGYLPKRASVSHVYKGCGLYNTEDALELLRYPVTLGNHPNDDHPVVLKLAKMDFPLDIGEQCSCA